LARSASKFISGSSRATFLASCQAYHLSVSVCLMALCVRRI
jgi:hypothetical protein